MPPRGKPVGGKPTAVKTESVTVNKANAKGANSRANSRGKPEVKRTILPSGDEIEEQDIEQKLNRLTDLLKMAKGSV